MENKNLWKSTNPLDKCIAFDTSGQRLDTSGLVNDKARLVKEIGKLRVQLYSVKFMDKSEQQSEFLRQEIFALKLQISHLKGLSGNR